MSIDELYRNDGEYYNDGTPRSEKEIRELRAHNKEQDDRMKGIEEMVLETRTALVGIDGKNGLRGELRDYQASTGARLSAIEAKLEQIIPTIFRIMGGVVAALSALAVVATFLLQQFGK